MLSLSPLIPSEQPSLEFRSKLTRKARARLPDARPVVLSNQARRFEGWQASVATADKYTLFEH